MPTATAGASVPELGSTLPTPTDSAISASSPPDSNVADASAASASAPGATTILSTAGSSPAAVDVMTAGAPASSTSSPGSARAAEPDLAAVSAGPAAQGIDWAGVIEELDRLRGKAFASPEGAGSVDYAVPGRAAWLADRAALAALAAAGQRIRGLTSKVVAIAPIVERDSALTTLRVTDIRSSYEVLARDGAVLARIPLSAKTIWRVTLASRQGRWLIDSVERE